MQLQGSTDVMNLYISLHRRCSTELNFKQIKWATDPCCMALMILVLSSHWTVLLTNQWCFWVHPCLQCVLVVCFRCYHDYVDVFTQMRNLDDDPLEVPLHGRYCGSMPEQLPHLLISMHNIFILGFYTDDEESDKGFLANYSFIDDCEYTYTAFCKYCVILWFSPVIFFIQVPLIPPWWPLIVSVKVADS